MEANGSWLVPTHTAAGLDFGIAPLPSGPAGRFTSVNPTGAVVYKGSDNPDAAWAFVKYLASPAAQEQLMQLKASLPVSKEVLAGPYAQSFDGAQVFADSPGTQVKPSFKGYDEFATTPRTSRHERVQRAQQDSEGGAGRRDPALDARSPASSPRWPCRSGSAPSYPTAPGPRAGDAALLFLPPNRRPDAAVGRADPGCSGSA
jgi:multiple sugar transport system substrate-binding protein